MNLEVRYLELFHTLRQTVGKYHLDVQVTVLFTAKDAFVSGGSRSQDSAVVPFNTYTFSKSVPAGHNSALTIPGGPCGPVAPGAPAGPGRPCGPAGPGGPCVPVLLSLTSFLSLSSNLTCLQNSTEETKKPSNGPVLHSYCFLQ